MPELPGEFDRRLSFQREIIADWTEKKETRKEEFIATYNKKTDSILLQGELRYDLEIDEFIVFLKNVKQLRENLGLVKKRIREGACECGSTDLKVIGKGDYYLGPLAGAGYDILQCESCGRQSKRGLWVS
jgi:hypothetical protein